MDDARKRDEGCFGKAGGGSACAFSDVLDGLAAADFRLDRWLDLAGLCDESAECHASHLHCAADDLLLEARAVEASWVKNGLLVLALAGLAETGALLRNRIQRDASRLAEVGRPGGEMDAGLAVCMMESLVSDLLAYRRIVRLRGEVCAELNELALADAAMRHDQEFLDHAIAKNAESLKRAIAYVAGVSDGWRDAAKL